MVTTNRDVHVCIARGAIRKALEHLERYDDPDLQDIMRAQGILRAASAHLNYATDPKVEDKDQ